MRLEPVGLLVLQRETLNHPVRGEERLRVGAQPRIGRKLSELLDPRTDRPFRNLHVESAADERLGVANGAAGVENAKSSQRSL